MARSEKEQAFLFSYSSGTGINGFCLCQRVGLQSPCGGVPWERVGESVPQTLRRESRRAGSLIERGLCTAEGPKNPTGCLAVSLLNPGSPPTRH